MAEEDIFVGTRCVLKIDLPFINLIKGMRGLCYCCYDDGQTFGFIFENGEHDGFSWNDTKKMLRIISGGSELFYEFTNVMKLSADFTKGLFPMNFKVPEAKSDDINPMEGVYGSY